MLCIALVQSIMITKLLGVEGRGVYGLAQASCEVFVLLFGLGVKSAIVYHVASGKITPPRALSVSLSICFFGSVLSIGLAALLFQFPTYNFLMPEGYKTLGILFYLFLIFPLNFSYTQLEAYYHANQKFIRSNRINMAFNLIRLTITLSLFSLWTFASYEFPLEWILYADAASLLIRLMVSIFLLPNTGKLTQIFQNLKFVLSDIRSMFQYSQLIYFTYLIMFFSTQLDIFIVEHFLNVKDLGHYSLARSLSLLLLFIPQVFQNVLFPYMSSQDTKEGDRMLQLFCRMSSFILITIAAVLYLSADFLVPFVYGNDFAESSIALKVLVLGMPILCLRHLIYYYNSCHKKQVRNLKYEGLGLVVGLSLQFILIPQWGILGAALSFVLAQLTPTAIAVFQHTKDLGSRFYHYVVLRPSDVVHVKNSLFKN